jgi:two-component system, cell cycle response regulator
MPLPRTGGTRRRACSDPLKVTAEPALGSGVATTDGRPLILVVDDTPTIRELVSAQLELAGYHTVQATNGEEALRLATEHQPDVIVLDVSMRGLDGYAVCRRLQERDTSAPPVIFLTANAHISARVEGLDSGAVDYVVKPFDAAELAARVRVALRTKARTEALTAAASTDGLTGLPNRRRLDERAAEAIAVADRYGRPLACLMIDVDHFKKINDTYGHAAGDAVLRETARRLCSVCRSADFVGRYGGEEFTVIMPETDLEGAVAAGERIRAILAAQPVQATGNDIWVTASVGVAGWEPGVRAPDDLYTPADRALYRAKQLGRNRVVAAPRQQPAEVTARG